jgi:type VI secretion system secreted protein Hcp
MAIDRQSWEPESPFTELEEGEQLLPEPETAFGEEETSKPVALRLRAPAQGLGRVYVQITGHTQGKIAGEPGSARHEGWLVGTGFDYELKAPRDVATGMPSGRRQHSPVTVTLPWGATSPLLFQAAATNEQLPTVVFEFPAVSQNGSEIVAQRVTLKDAAVASYRHLADATGSPAELDRVSFTFRQITIEDLVGKTTAHDDWGAVQQEAGEAEAWEAETYEIDGAGVRRSSADAFA